MVKDAIIAKGIDDSAVVEALSRVPRHLFVPDEYVGQAYENHALPIGFGQSISPPFLVALMTQELGLQAGGKILEIGTGSGYQAAVLAEMGMEVYTVENVPQLSLAANTLLAELGYANVHGTVADGYFGWPEQAPLDAILVTAAVDHVPSPLASQLKTGGVMVIPVGPLGAVQELWKITRNGEDDYTTIGLGEVHFVPLTSGIPSSPWA